jgi:biopolymer transport protein TolQ
MWIQVETDLLLLLRDTGIVARIVLLILLIFSVWSWGIILSKVLLLRKVSRESEVFWKIFRKGQSLSEISTAGETLRVTPLVPVFNAAADLMRPRSVHSVGALAVKTEPTSAVVQRAMQRAASAQLTRLESRLIFLATTAAVAPFIGLFGTVWGILTSFVGLSNSGSTTLKAVAPGIAEALITTAFGLFAAIPAVIAYNQFVYRIRNIGGQLDDLQTEVLTLTERGGQ